MSGDVKQNGEIDKLTATPQEDKHGDGRWMSQHLRHVYCARNSDPEIVFIGDTVFHQLGISPVWTKVFAPMHAVNFSIPGDGCEQVLWRIDEWRSHVVEDESRRRHSAVLVEEGMKPKVIVVQVGTENYNLSAEQVANGVVQVMQRLSEHYPLAKLVFVGLLPRGENPNRLRAKNEEVNRQLCVLLSEIPNTVFMHIDDIDFVQHGYDKICLKILEVFRQFLSETNLLIPGHILDAVKKLVSSDEER